MSPRVALAAAREFGWTTAERLSPVGIPHEGILLFVKLDGPSRPVEEREHVTAEELIALVEAARSGELWR